MAAAGSAKAQAALKKQTEQQAAEYARVVRTLLFCAAHNFASYSFCLATQVGELELSDSLLQKVQPVCAIRPPSRLGIVLIPSVYNAQAKATIKELQEENKVLSSKCEDFTLVFGDVPKKSN